VGVRYVIARAENELHGAILEKIGADKVIYPERDMGIRVAHELTLTDVSDYISLTSSYGVAKVEALPSFVGRTLSELELGRGGKWGVAVLVIQHEKEFVVTPDRMELVKSGDVLIVAGNDEKIQQWLTESKKG
jgi:trk system potassium uptake protein TrkA